MHPPAGAITGYFPRSTPGSSTGLNLESNRGLTSWSRGQRDAGEQETFAHRRVIEVVVQLTMTAWLVLEAGLLIRDRGLA